MTIVNCQIVAPLVHECAFIPIKQPMKIARQFLRVINTAWVTGKLGDVDGPYGLDQPQPFSYAVSEIGYAHTHLSRRQPVRYRCPWSPVRQCRCVSPSSETRAATARVVQHNVPDIMRSQAQALSGIDGWRNTGSLQGALAPVGDAPPGLASIARLATPPSRFCRALPGSHAALTAPLRASRLK
jgi:hypothetical protein